MGAQPGDSAVGVGNCDGGYSLVSGQEVMVGKHPRTIECFENNQEDF